MILFAWVAAEQGGLPIPAAPVLLAAGALASGHAIRFWLALLWAVAGAVLADVIWFMIGRRRGHAVMRLLCKLSFEPAVCVRRSQDMFVRHPLVTLTVSKFVPGLTILASPLAGQSGMTLRSFLWWDGVGSALWVISLLAAGYFGVGLVAHDVRLMHWSQQFSGVLLVAIIAAVIAWKVIRQRRELRKLEAARVEPYEVKQRLDVGEEFAIVDLRHPVDVLVEPYTLPGAIRLSPEALVANSSMIPRDRDVVLYCTCPNEATAARTALSLRKLGIVRVHPLRGGYDEWKRLGFPLERIPPSEFSRQWSLRADKEIAKGKRS